MKLNRNLLILILLLLGISFGVSSCGSYRQTALADDYAYVLLLGDPDGKVVIIDDDQPIHLGQDTSSYNLNGVTATKIQVSIGKHTIKVTQDQKLIAKRAFYVANGNSFELQL